MGETAAFVLLLVATLTRSSEVSPAERLWTRERLWMSCSGLVSRPVLGVRHTIRRMDLGGGLS